MKSSKLIFIIALFLSGCAVWPVGEDPKGKELKSLSDKVVMAIKAYEKSNNELPESIEILVPQYLLKIPDELELFYSKEKAELVLDYTPSWPQIGRTSCGLKLGQDSWQCLGYL